MTGSEPRSHGIQAMAEFLLLKHHPAIACRMVDELNDWMDDRMKSSTLRDDEKQAIIKEFVC